jgi:condensin-2 complex subunit G2
LFRSLNVANPLVRKNASIIFTDTFPFVNSDLNREDNDFLLHRQFELLKEIIYDQNPIVRSVSVEGVSRVLCVYWEIIPKEIIYTLIKSLVMDLANDCTSSIVRKSVVDGVHFILDNHLSHITLKSNFILKVEILPKMEHLIDDTSALVRLSMVELLLKLKGLREIVYFDVVSIEKILNHLAYDNEKIQDKLTILIMNSFYPINKPTNLQVKY